MTLKCESVCPLLSAYMDDECNAKERELVEQHLAQCAECREELHILKAEAAWVAQLAEPIPEGVHASIMARVGAERPVKKRIRLPVRALAATVAACAVFCVALSVYLHLRTDPDLPFLRKTSAQNAAVGFSLEDAAVDISQCLALSPTSDGVWLAEAVGENDTSAVKLLLQGDAARWIENGSERLGSVSYGTDGKPVRLVFAEGAYAIVYDEAGGMTVRAEG